MTIWISISGGPSTWSWILSKDGMVIDRGTSATYNAASYHAIMASRRVVPQEASQPIETQEVA